MKNWLLLVCLFAFVFLSACSTKQQEKTVELTISAAASLQDALLEIKSEFEEENPDIQLQFNFGSSGALQQQIIQGAPVDVFFSAAEDDFDQLVKEGLINSKKTSDLVGNELVLVIPKSIEKPIRDFEELPALNQISIGTPEAVPAGKYAMQTLKALKLWDDLERKIVYAKDVRQVLTYVETGNVDAGIVYKTDAMSSKDVKIVAAVSENHHNPIVYPVGVVEKSKHQEEAALFFEFVQNDKSLEIFQDYHFKSLKK